MFCPSAAPLEPSCGGVARELTSGASPTRMHHQRAFLIIAWLLMSISCFPHIDTQSKTVTKSLSVTKPQPDLERKYQILMLKHHKRQTKTEDF